jgi:hypothetical protein
VLGSGAGERSETVAARAEGIVLATPTAVTLETSLQQADALVRTLHADLLER